MCLITGDINLILLHFLTEIFCEEGLCLHPLCLFVQLVRSVCEVGSGISSLACNAVLLFIVLLKLFPLWPLRALSGCVFPFEVPRPFLCLCLTF